MIMLDLVGFGCAGTPVLLALLLYIVLTKLYYVTLLFSRITAPSFVPPSMPQITRLTGECYGVICNGVSLLWDLSPGSWWEISTQPDLLVKIIWGNMNTDTAMEEFHECLFNLELVDMHFLGPMFTWINRCAGDQFIARKLDRSLQNEFCLDTFLNAVTKFLNPGLSDHCPLIVNLNNCLDPMIQTPSTCEETRD